MATALVPNVSRACAKFHVKLRCFTLAEDSHSPGVNDRTVHEITGLSWVFATRETSQRVIGQTGLRKKYTDVISNVTDYSLKSSNPFSVRFAQSDRRLPLRQVVTQL